MDIQHLRPRVFAADPESGDSKRQWKHMELFLKPPVLKTP